MKSIMLTIRLKWFYLTYKGIKTIEVRKTMPKDFIGDVYEVVSKTNFEKDLTEIPENEREFFRQFKGKVGLKFTLNRVELIRPIALGSFLITPTLEHKEILDKSCLTENEIRRYLTNMYGYAWHIDNLVIFDKPKELNEFKVSKIINVTCNLTYLKAMHTIVRKPLTKAPESWCYIESENEND